MKLSRETLADRLQEQLKRQMLSGRLAPGAVMPSERELREVFGVGRTRCVRRSRAWCRRAS